MAHLLGSSEAADTLSRDIYSATKELSALLMAQQSKLSGLSESCRDESYENMEYLVKQMIQYVQYSFQDIKTVYNRLIAYRDFIQSLESGGSDSGVAGIDGETLAQWRSTYQSISVKQTGQQWSDSLTPAQRDAVRQYTGEGYKQINPVLRGQQRHFPSESYRNCARELSGALQQSSIPCDCVVYRGTDSNGLGKLNGLSDAELVGKHFTDNGFYSTSINAADSFGGGVKWEIEVPKGAKGAYVGYLSKHGHAESEVLFDRGQLIKILSVRRDAFGNRIIRGRMLI